MTELTEIHVPVIFNGQVVVKVPAEFVAGHPEAAQALAEKVALSHVSAITVDPDAPDPGAFEELTADYPHLFAAGLLGRSWDEAKCAVAGRWDVPNIVMPPNRVLPPEPLPTRQEILERIRAHNQRLWAGHGRGYGYRGFEVCPGPGFRQPGQHRSNH
jgi:hypothetical protein